jgi:hypothetical protein
MTKATIKTRSKAVLEVLATLVWRGFGLFLFILGGAAGTGAIVTGSWVDGVVIAWLTLMIGVIGAIGYAIATTGSATSETVARATNDAVQKAQEKKG